MTFLCHANLVRLFAPFAAQIELIATWRRRTSFRFQMPDGEPPFRLGTELGTIPNEVPYLSASKHRCSQMAGKTWEPRVKIGIGWQGNPWGQIDKGRYHTLGKIPASVRAIPGVRLISLQKIHGMDQLNNLPAGMKSKRWVIFDQGEDGFVDTAAIIQTSILLSHPTRQRPTLRARSAFPRGLRSNTCPTGAGCSTATIVRGTRRCGFSASQTRRLGTSVCCNGRRITTKVCAIVGMRKLSSLYPTRGGPHIIAPIMSVRSFDDAHPSSHYGQRPHSSSGSHIRVSHA